MTANFYQRQQPATDKIKPFPVQNLAPVTMPDELEIPHDELAEKAVLGSILAAAEVLPGVMEVLKPDYFFSEARQKCYSLLVNMAESGEPIDFITVRARLKAKDLLWNGEGNGEGKILEGDLINWAKLVPNPFSAPGYAKMVLLKWIDRQKIDLSTRLVNAGYYNGNLEPIIKKLKELDDLAKGSPETVSTITAADLIKKEFAPAKWIISGLVPEGSLLLAAKPKIGKSWLVLGWALAVALGGMALGKPVEAGSALYLALEDNERRLKQRILQLCPDGKIPAGLELATNWKRSDEGGLEDLENWIKRHPDARLIVIDTLAKWRRPASGRDNIYRADYEAVESATQLAGKYQVSIVIVHHSRKGTGEDPLEEISGSFGLTGAVDNALVLRRGRGEADATLHPIGRDFDQDNALALQFKDGFWAMLGNAEDFELSKARREILEVLKDHQHKGIYPIDVARALGADKDRQKTANIRQMMRTMVEAGQIRQDDSDRYYPIKLDHTDHTHDSDHTDHTDHTSSLRPLIEATNSVTYDTNLPEQTETVMGVTTVIGVIGVMDNESFQPKTLADFNRAFRSITDSQRPEILQMQELETLLLHAHDVLSMPEYAKFDKTIKRVLTQNRT